MVSSARSLLVAAAVIALVATTVPMASAAPTGAVTLLVTAKQGTSVQQAVGRNGGTAGRVISRWASER